MSGPHEDEDSFACEVERCEFCEKWDCECE